jgi:hypothetical protein
MRREWLALAMAAPLFLVATPARADDGSANPVTATEGTEAEPAARLARSYAARPVTLPPLVLDPTSRFDVARQTGTTLNLAFGAALGVTDDVEVEALAAPLQLWPSVTYGQLDQPGPRAGITYRAVGGNAEVALHVDGTAITLPRSSGAIVRPGFLVREHAGTKLRIDSGVFLRATIAHTTSVGLEAPFALSVDVAPPVHIGFRTGLSLDTFDAPLGLDVPLGVFAGYAIGGKDGALLDIDPFFLWPQLLTLATQSQSTTSTFQVGIDIRWFLYL